MIWNLDQKLNKKEKRQKKKKKKNVKQIRQGRHDDYLWCHTRFSGFYRIGSLLPTELLLLLIYLCNRKS